MIPIITIINLILDFKLFLLQNFRKISQRMVNNRPLRFVNFVPFSLVTFANNVLASFE